MANRTDVAKGREIVARWCALAEARLEHLTELFETGRWRLYHSEVALRENIQEARRAVETWRDLLQREASLDNHRHVLARQAIADGQRAAARAGPAATESHRSAARAAGPCRPVAAVVEEVSLEEAPSVVAEKAPALATPMPPLLDLATMQSRYPLLRNTL
jgi:uncharacterized repeat protein (TIGR03809 family)